MATKTPTEPTAYYSISVLSAGVSRCVTDLEILAKLAQINTEEAARAAESVCTLRRNGSRYSNNDFDVLSYANGVCFRALGAR